MPHRHSRSGPRHSRAVKTGRDKDAASSASPPEVKSYWRNHIEPGANERQPLERLSVPPGMVRLLLDRSLESASRDEPTQDYLVIEHSPARLSFAVTDGVGSSFVGELAAQFLARRVAKWLFDLQSVA